MSVFSYDGSEICFMEARIIAVQTLIQNSLTTLNTALARSPVSLPTTTLPVIASTDVVMGEFSRFDETRTLQIEVIGGGFNPTQEAGVDYRYPDSNATPTSFATTVQTLVKVWLNPNIFPVTATTMSSTRTQGYNRAITHERIMDWLRNGVFNTNSGRSITLTSVENGVADKYDNVKMQSIVAGYQEKQFGSSTYMYCIQVNLTGVNN